MDFTPCVFTDFDYESKRLEIADLLKENLVDIDNGLICMNILSIIKYLDCYIVSEKITDEEKNALKIAVNRLFKDMDIFINVAKEKSFNVDKDENDILQQLQNYYNKLLLDRELKEGKVNG